MRPARPSALLFGIACALTYAPVPAQAEVATPDNTKWFREAKFGVFIHWGVYAVIGRHEWARQYYRIPQAEYDKYARAFNPVRFDSDEWVRTIKNAGARYLVITSKHHDGFSLYRSKVSPYDMEITPYKGDPLKSLADSAKRGGLRLGFYHSIMDWRHPDYRPRREWEYPKDAKTGGNNLRYVGFMKDQLRELLTGYGDVAMIWFDGEWEHTLQETKTEDDVFDLIRKLQPRALINDRIYERKPGNRADFGTPEQFVPATGMTDPSGKPIPWEACVTINTDSWGYNQYETQFKTRRDLIRLLAEVVSKGGNLLLNIGPMPDGRIQPEFTTRLAAIGEWLHTNGESVYETTASPFPRLPFFGRATTKGAKLYLHVFAWPQDGRLRVPGLKNKVLGARILGRPESKLAVRRDGADAIVTLPSDPPDEADSVVALELDGPPAVDSFIVKPDGRGVVTLGIESSEIESRLGQKAKKENALGHVFLTNWTRGDDVPTWDFTLPAAGKYKVDATYGIAAKATGLGKEVAISVGDVRLTGKVTSTDGEWAWQTFALGSIDLPAGKHKLRIKALDPGGVPGMALEKLVLTPAP